jgi:RimJ/RimL family protein N-acetyltransferase
VIHNLTVDGYCYRLRPVTLDDAAFIVNLRTDSIRSKYINPISDDVSLQIDWLNCYFDRVGDYYFVVEHIESRKPEGLISLYDVSDRSAEWGRWIIETGSSCAIESAMLIYQLAFEHFSLESVYCRTLEVNGSVISFHDSSGANRSRRIENHVMIDNVFYSAIEHELRRETWEMVNQRLDSIAYRMSRKRSD